MVGILGFIAERLASIGIPYEFGEWTQKVQYPYFVGSYAIDQHRFEDGYTGGTFILTGWSRGENALQDLAKASDVIQEEFSDLMAVEGNRTFFISFGTSQPIPTGEDGLSRIDITLYTNEWKGE